MTTNFFGEAFNALSDDDFDEIPVEIEEFVTSKDFLDLPPLSDYQYTMIRAGSQIYRYSTLVSLYGEERASERWKQTCNEIILQLGKGSGKDYTSTIVCVYVVYLLLCLKDPARYYGKPKDDTIDIVNIAVNADQARNVFFANLVKRVKSCPWFEGKFYDKNNAIEFDKSIRVFSGHSEREAFEGLNLFLAVLDEISAFALESHTGNAQANTADATYKMYRASVDSRFPDFGKVYLLSFPRFDGDYIQQKYNDAVAEKEVIERRHTFKRDPDLPDDTEGNEFTITWDEDHILRYRHQNVFALRRPTWEVNPTVRIDSPAMIRAFDTDPGDALGRFACMPSNLSNGFFKNKEAIEQSFSRTNGVDNDSIFRHDFIPKKDTKYFIHVDLAQKHDYCAVAMAHVDRWVEISIGSQYKEIHPYVVVDALRWWTPTKEKSVDFAEVRDYIIALRRRGFDLQLVTFDRWNSHDTMNILTNSHGIQTDTLSVGKRHYDDFLSVMYDNRLSGPNEEILKKELSELRIVKDKVDHPRTGSKDLSDATCGAIYNAIVGTPKRDNLEVEILTGTDVRRKAVQEYRDEQARKAQQGGVIAPPPRSGEDRMPDTLEEYLRGIRTL